MWHELIFLPFLHLFILYLSIDTHWFYHLCSHLVLIHYLYLLFFPDRQTDRRTRWNDTSCTGVNGNDWNWVIVMCYLKQMWASSIVTTSCLASSGTLAWTDRHINIWPHTLNQHLWYFLREKGVSRSTFSLTRSKHYQVAEILEQRARSEPLTGLKKWSQCITSNLRSFWWPGGGDSTGFRKKSDWI